MRADIHDGPEHTLQSEAGYIDARPHHRGRRNLLHRTAGPYSRVILDGAAQAAHLLIAAPPPKADANSCDLRCEIETGGNFHSADYGTKLRVHKATRKARKPRPIEFASSARSSYTPMPTPAFREFDRVPVRIMNSHRPFPRFVMRGLKKLHASPFQLLVKGIEMVGGQLNVDARPLMGGRALRA